MKLTVKDKEFLEALRGLLDEGKVWVDFREDGIKRLRLRQNYGVYVEQRFGMTRQGVRWRFNRLLNDVYPSAYETVLWVETSFGTELRSQAMAIARQRVELRNEAGRALGPVVR